MLRRLCAVPRAMRAGALAARGFARSPRGRMRSRARQARWLLVLLVLWLLQAGTLAAIQIAVTVQPDRFDDICFSVSVSDRALVVGGAGRSDETGQTDEFNESAPDSAVWHCPFYVLGERPVLPVVAVLADGPRVDAAAPPPSLADPLLRAAPAYVLPLVRAPPVTVAIPLHC